MSFVYRRSDGGERLEIRHDSTRETADANTEIVHSTDGSRTEITRISEAADWSIEGLHGATFGTRGASVARTTFNPRGAPVVTVFQDARGDELSTIRYVCDDAGKILDAIQYGAGAVSVDPRLAPWLQATGEPAVVQAFTEPGAEQFRVHYRYDDAGRVVEEESGFAGRVLHRTTKTYNDHGDLLASATENEDPVRFEYEYDERGNWTRQVVRHALGLDRYARSITYFND